MEPVTHWNTIIDIMTKSNYKKVDFLKESKVLGENIDKIFNNNKIDELSKSIFQDIRNPQLFKETCEDNIDQLNKVVKVLTEFAKSKGNSELTSRDTDLSSVIIANINEVFLEKNHNHPITKSQADVLSNQLIGYSKRLELEYNQIYHDAQELIRLQSRQVNGSQIEKLKGRKEAPLKLAENIENNFRLGKVNFTGEIKLPQLEENENLFHYLQKNLNSISRNLHIVKRRGLAYVTVSDYIDSVVKLINKDPNNKDWVKQVSAEGMKNIINDLDKITGRTAQNLRLFFMASGALGDHFAEKTNLLLTVPDLSNKGALIPEGNQQISMSLNQVNELKVTINETFQMDKYAEGTKVSTKAIITVDPKKVTQSEPKVEYSVELIGDFESPEFHEVARVVDLAKIPLKVVDYEEPQLDDNVRPHIFNMWDNYGQVQDIAINKIEEIQDIDVNQKPITSFEPQFAQVLQGKDSFYIGIEGDHRLLSQSVNEFLKTTGIDSKEFFLPVQAHSTLVPPGGFISLKTNVGELAESLKSRELDLVYNTITISERGNVVLLGENNENYKSITQGLAKVLNVKSTDRDPHMALGKLSNSEVEKIFNNPEKYGFEVFNRGDSVRRLKKKLTQPLTQPVIFSMPNQIPVEQKLLALQSEGGGISPKEILENKEKFQMRSNQVIHEQKLLKEKGIEYKFKGKDIPFSTRQLEMATTGLGKESLRLPLVFSTIRGGEKLWKEFNNDVMEILKKYEIDDGEIQMLGSAIHGYSRNPAKDLKPWRPDSDCDLAVFSKKLAKMCLEYNVIPNKKIKMNGLLTVFKNEVDEKSKEEGKRGFHDTEIGKEFFKLGERWSLIIYGEDYPPDHVDFKMNISLTPFREAISLKPFKEEVNK